MPSLEVTLVAAAGVTLLTTVFTRDFLLAFGGYVAFYLFIFAPTYQVPQLTGMSPPYDIVDVFLYVPAAAAVFAALGIAASKLFDIGQLIDVWPTGAGGGPNAREELNVPFMVLALVLGFFTTFFAVAAVQAGAGEPFLNGLVTLSTAVAALLAVLFALGTLAAVFSSGVQRKRGARFRGIHDWASVVYLFVWLVALAGALLPWYLVTGNVVTAGWWAGGLGGALLFVGFIVGFAYERYRDTSVDYHPVGGDGGEAGAQPRRKIYTRQGRLYSVAAPLWWLVVRAVVVVLLYAGTFVLGGYAIKSVRAEEPPNTEPVRAVFWAPWLALWAFVLILLFVGAYVALLVCWKWPRYFLGRPDGESAGDDVGDVLPPTDDDGGDDDDEFAKSPPPVADSEARATTVVVGGVASRTRRRVAAASGAVAGGGKNPLGLRFK